jgi:uncharacterized protein YerC
MINVFDDTPEDKEREILDMLERGYGYKQIMKECHVSPVTISKVRKAMLGSTGDDDDSSQSTKTTKESQAFRLFQQGKSIIDTKIELDIESTEVVDYYRKYQELRFLGEFNRAYDSVKGNIAPFLQLFNLMSRLSMTPEQVVEQVKHGDNLPNLQSIHTKMNNQIQDMASKHYYLDSQLQSTAKEVQECKNSLQFYDNECVQKRKEIASLGSEINRKKRVIRMLDNNKGYNRIKECAKQETEGLLQDNRELLTITVSAVLEAIRRYDAIRDLIFEIVTSSSATTCGEPWIQSHKSRLVELSEHIQMEMKEQITNNVIRSFQGTNSESETVLT